MSRHIWEKTNKYDYASFIVNTGTTDYDVRANVAAMFNNRESAYGLLEITTDQDVSIKFNSTSNPGIDVTSTMSPYKRDDLVVDKIYISNASGINATITIYANYI